MRMVCPWNRRRSEGNSGVLEIRPIRRALYVWVLLLASEKPSLMAKSYFNARSMSATGFLTEWRVCRTWI